MRFVVRRSISSLLVIIAVPIAVFFLSRLTGDPVALMRQPDMTEEQVVEMRKALGFYGPLHEQFFTFATRVSQGDFGTSIWQRRPAFELVLDRMPATALLAGTALAFSIIIAIPVGSLAARWHNTLLDRLVMLVALVGQSMPNFWLGLMLILLFAVSLHWLPTSGYGESLDSRPAHLLLPAVTLGFFSMARLARLTRSALLEVLGQDYIRTARAKGLWEWAVFRGHALRNALIPIVTILALDIGALLSGAVVTETIFAWPGVGRLMLQAIERRDFPIVQAGVVVVAVLYTFFNLVADLLYARIDPRIRYS
ncbi:MAG: ABC transporter permease [Chloroflexi bacterium]|nr:ABC transporter permease [Chloroflexota bacterium]